MNEEYNIKKAFTPQLPHSFNVESAEHFVIDANSNNFSSSNIVSFSSESIVNAQKFWDISNSYITVPCLQRSTLRDANGQPFDSTEADILTNVPRFNTFDASAQNNFHSLKNSVFSIISYVSVSLNNFTLAEAQGANNGTRMLYDLESKCNNEYVDKNVASLLYYPESHENQKYIPTASSAATIGQGLGDCEIGTSNTSNYSGLNTNTNLQKAGNESRRIRQGQIPVFVNGSDTQGKTDATKFLAQSEIQKNLFGGVTSLNQVLGSYTIVGDFTVSTYYVIRIPLKHLCDLLAKIPPSMRLSCRISLQLHHRSSSTAVYSKTGAVTSYTASTINGIIPYNVSSPTIIESLTTLPTRDNECIIRYNQAAVAADTHKAFSIYTTFDIASTAHKHIDETLGQVDSNHWLTTCQLHCALLTMTQQLLAEYQKSPFKDIRYNSIYSEKSTITVEGGKTQTLSISNIGFSRLRQCVIYFFSTASVANGNINSVESHWSSAPMSSSRTTIGAIQATLSSQNLYTEVMNSQNLAYQVLNSSSYKSGQENFSTSGQITESMYNISPILVLDLTKHSKEADAVLRTIQVRFTNLSKQTLQPYFYLYTEENILLNPSTGEIQTP